MIIQIKDGPLVIGIGRTLDEAVHIACDTNKRLGGEPTDPHDMKRMIDTGSLHVREIKEATDAHNLGTDLARG